MGRLIVLDAGLDTSTPAGEMVLTALAMAARFEHRRISERQTEVQGRSRPRPRHDLSCDRQRQASRRDDPWLHWVVHMDGIIQDDYTLEG